MTVNDTTNSLTTRIIFAKEKESESCIYRSLRDISWLLEFKTVKIYIRGTDLDLALCVC